MLYNAAGLTSPVLRARRKWRTKKRILVLVATVALMTTMLAVSVAPAFARPPLYECTHPETGTVAIDIPSNAKHFFFKEGFECVEQ